MVNNTLIDNCHRQNIKIIPWTVDEAHKIKQLKAMEVDGIISDYPDYFKPLTQNSLIISNIFLQKKVI